MILKIFFKFSPDFFGGRKGGGLLGSVELEMKGKVAFVTLKRPEKLNALNKEMWIGIKKKLEEVNLDEEVKVVVLTGEGRAFSAGDDIYEMFKAETFRQSWDFFLQIVYPSLEAFLKLEKISIAAVNGLAVGGGCEITLLCDLAFASEKAFFAVPEIKIGAFPPIATSLLPDLIGYKRAAYLIFTGERISAKEAKEIGLINDFFPENKFFQETKKIAEEIANLPEYSLKLIKIWLNRKRKNKRFKEAIKDLVLLSQTKEYRERTEAFIKKK